MKKRPFFILGCVRSGTTFLRDVLRCHPSLAAPEETHFYRWSEPFGTQGYKNIIWNNKTLLKHRELDGISQENFSLMLKKSTSRAELYRQYMRQYIKQNKPEAGRWFDKTPQNVYGAPMIASEFPGAKFVHIVRNPLDVVSSLKVGKVMSVPQVIGACNYWKESIEIMKVMTRACPKRVYEVRYEDLIADFGTELKQLLDFINEDYDETYFSGIKVRPKKHDHREIFTQEELNRVETLCGPLAKPYGYLS